MVSFFFLVLIKMSETYGSDNLRAECLHEEKGKKVKRESLLLNLSDYWTLLNAEFNHLYYLWYHLKVALLEKQIRKKLVNNKDLPLANVFIKKFQDKDLHFSPVSYLDEGETYLEMMQEQEKYSENEYLRKYPHLRRKDWPVRHKKFSRNQKKKLVFLR